MLPCTAYYNSNYELLLVLDLLNFFIKLVNDFGIVFKTFEFVVKLWSFNRITFDFSWWIIHILWIFSIRKNLIESFSVASVVVGL